MRIEHNGRTHSFRTAHEWLRMRSAADIVGRESMDNAATEGTITDDAGRPLAEPQQTWMKRRLAGAHEGLPEARDHLLGSRARRPGPRKMAIPCLWPWGHMPSFSGNQKAGKSCLVTGELVPALVVPGFRFLDHFDPAQIGPTELGRGIWVINAETPAEDYEAQMEWLWDVPVTVGDDMQVPARELVTVWHLDEHGGATAFDLTDPAKYERWADILGDCEDCDGSDFWTPFVVIVDGLTAILGGTTERYAAWDAAFRQLMRAYDVPNALWVGHSTMQGNHGMGGVEALGGPDGLWVYSSDNPDNPTSTRRFSVVPRMGGVAVPPTVVRLDPDGRLRMGQGEPAMATAAATDPPSDPAAEVLAELVRAGAAGLTTTQVTAGGGEVGVQRRRARDRLAEEGRIVSRLEGRCTRWWAAEFAPPP